MQKTISGPDGVASTVRPLLIHIGLHKAGSTTLQSQLFDDRDHGFMRPRGKPRHSLVHDLVDPDPLFYDPRITRACYTFDCEQAVDAGMTLVLSHERLSGYPSSGGRDREMIARRLAETFPEASILLVIREQSELIRSMYSQHITDGGVESIDRFLDRPEPALGRRPSFVPELYQFDRLIELYHSLFGRERVLVLPFEALCTDPAAFIETISLFSGHKAAALDCLKPANTRRPLLMQHVQRPLNMLFYHNELSPGALFHIPRFHKRYAKLRVIFDAISPAWLERQMSNSVRRSIERRLGSYYGDSNLRTEALTGLRLAEFGYDVAR